MTDTGPDRTELHQTTTGETGKRLREARESKGWDLNSVAESLHLRPAVVQAIENGHYRDVPELFLKGYIRTYGRLVGLDGDSLVDQLEHELEPLREQEAQEQAHSPIFHIEVKKRRKRRIARWVAIFLLIAIIVAIFIGINGVPSNFRLPGSDVDQAGEELPPEAATLVTLDEAEGKADLPPVGTEDSYGREENPDTEALPESALPGSGTPITSAPVTESLPETAEIEPVAPEAGVESAGVEEAAEPVPALPATGSEPQTETAMASFTIEFSGDCWVEVRNAAGERIEASLQGSGDALSMSGRPPLTFILGDVEAVESFVFEGETIPVAGYGARNGRAEFTLGEGPNT